MAAIANAAGHAFVLRHSGRSSDRCVADRCAGRRRLRMRVTLGAFGGFLHLEASGLPHVPARQQQRDTGNQQEDYEHAVVSSARLGRPALSLFLSPSSWYSKIASG